MYKVCMVSGCLSPSNASYHRIPKQDALRSLWLKALEVKEAGSSQLVCSTHFSKEFLSEDSSRLKKDAVPTLNLRKPPFYILENHQSSINPPTLSLVLQSADSSSPEDSLREEIYELKEKIKLLNSLLYREHSEKLNLKREIQALKRKKPALS